MDGKKVVIGVLGLGTVGTGVARAILEQSELLTQRTGLTFQLKTVVDINWKKDRGLDLSSVHQTDDVHAVLDDPEVDIVVETIGGYEPAATFIRQALRNGKHVVTANKALIATKGKELFTIAQENNVDLLFEASVGGGIPIIKGLREGLVANHFLNIYGIVNGTSNYILTRMHQSELDFQEALSEAQAKGFAEADPTLDIGGGDAAHKVTILGSLAIGGMVDFAEVPVEGITELTPLDINFAKSFGYVVKLLAICRLVDGRLDLRVHPTLVPNNHLLAAVNEEKNAIFVQGDFVGNTMFYGPGAGERPTASAIVSDIVDLSRDLMLKDGIRFSSRAIDPNRQVNLVPTDEISNRYYIRIFTEDKPGILSKISGTLGQYGISISSMVQLETHGDKNYVPIVLLTHKAPETSMDNALKAIKGFDFVRPDLLRLRLFS
ncbi:MAG TPA: homoserine dehydrogenase [Bacillota bacterium]|nr:homoserine dehydrogenase [Bacillota bacterium]